MNKKKQFSKKDPKHTNAKRYNFTPPKQKLNFQYQKKGKWKG